MRKRQSKIEYKLRYVVRCIELDQFMRDHNNKVVESDSEESAKELAEIFTNCSRQHYHYDVVKCY